MVLKHFILPEMHFKANLFFFIMTLPNKAQWKTQKIENDTANSKKSCIYIY